MTGTSDSTTTERKPSEGGHWYTPGTTHKWGRACYEVLSADGSRMRATTLRDARQQGLAPSVTMITSQITDLRHWWGNQVAMSALTLPEIPGESADDRLKRILKDASEQAETARQTGKELHGAMEDRLLGRPVEHPYKTHVEAAMAELEKLVPEGQMDTCLVEQVVTHDRIGLGGKVDFAWVNEQDVKEVLVVDFKTKAFDESTKMSQLARYPEQPMQLAAYCAMLRGNLNKSHLVNIFISTSVPGLVRVKEYDYRQHWMKAFIGLYTYWCNKNRFWPKPTPHDLA